MCALGFYCPYDEVEPVVCPPGAYCGFKSHKPKLCPIGTYNPFAQMGLVSDCLPCKGGYHCNARGIGDLEAFGDKFKCPLGHFCYEGYDLQPTPCYDGSYLD